MMALFSMVMIITESFIATTSLLEEKIMSMELNPFGPLQKEDCLSLMD